MNNKNILQPKQYRSVKNKGFVTLEILVSIFIASAFLAVSMQSLVYAMAMKIQAQEKNRANELITEQLERANELANSSSLAGICDAPVYNDGYGSGLWAALAFNPVAPPNKAILSDGGGRRVALEATEVSAPSTAPHRTLRIRYEIWEWGDPIGPVTTNNFLDRNGNVRTAGVDEPIAETYVEIIPDVALACP